MCGCISPLELVPRVQISKYPSDGRTMLKAQRCQSYLFFGLSSLARVQVAPKSIEMSTCFTVLSPDQAAPRSLSSLVLAGNLSPFAGLEMIERTGIDSRSRKLLSSGLPPGTI